MALNKCLLLFLFIGINGVIGDEFLYGTFPEDFKFGFATSAYQIEGGYNEDGKGQSNWDYFTHLVPSQITDNSTGDIACDSYHKYLEDVELLKLYNAQTYRFSISWTRILPLGTLDVINQPGIDYYNNLINALLENNITPLVTLYHWDIPQVFQSDGGWQNEAVVNYFADYARLCYESFGDRVKFWITINEPQIVSTAGEPFKKVDIDGSREYERAHNIIKAHGIAYRIYQTEFKETQGGVCGITLDTHWWEPEDPTDPTHLRASETTMDFKYGWFANPIVYGAYPASMRELVDRRSSEEGLEVSRLPHFDANWTKIVNGSYDFIGLNHYSSEYVRPCEIGSGSPGWDWDMETIRYPDEHTITSACGWLRYTPWGFRKLLNWIKSTYQNPVVYITENGWCDDPEVSTTEDNTRATYYTFYINELLKAITLDGCNVKGYSAWSLLDNFEWGSGYTRRFGVTHIDMNDPTRTRIPKLSSEIIRKIYEDRGFPM